MQSAGSLSKAWLSHGLCILVAGLAFGANAQTAALPASQNSSAALLYKYSALRPALTNNAFGRSLVIESAESNNRITGDAYAVMDAPFATVSSVLPNPGRMCDLITLHLNTKYCRPASKAGATILNVNFGKKIAQELSNTYPLEFTMQAPVLAADLMEVVLDAKEGPLGTSNYRIAIEAVPLSASRTFLHLRYSYGYGVAGKIAMRGYLATAGSKKVGFTRAGQENGAPYIGGMRGAIERNTMRYYLAIDAYFANLQVPFPQQLDARLNHWFDATERYPEQLAEVEKTSYITMKKAEFLRQQSDAGR